MPTTITIASPDGDHVFELDATLTQEHDADAEVTENPVEEGAAVVDHINVKAWNLSISGIIAYHPVVQLGEVLVESRAVDAWKVLEKAFTEKRLLKVETGLKSYDNMAITKFSTHRDTNSGKNIPVSLSLRQVRRATAKSIVVPKDAIGKGAPGAPAADSKVQAEDTQAQATAREDRGLVSPTLVDSSLGPIQDTWMGLQNA